MNKKKISKKNNKKQKRKLRSNILNYTFLISLPLTILFAIQTNKVFWIPFITALTITMTSMITILILAVIRKTRKRIEKQKKISA